MTDRAFGCVISIGSLIICNGLKYIAVKAFPINKTLAIQNSCSIWKSLTQGSRRGLQCQIVCIGGVGDCR
eukprot:scaffold16197_cov50-Cyclotella_meneghiniana.AAC.1